MSQVHPFIVHFPIALIISAFIFTFIGLFYRRGLFKEVVFWNLIFGLMASAAAIYTGLVDEKNLVNPDQHVTEIMEAHKRNAYIICTFLLGLTVWMGFRKKEMRMLEYMAWTAFLMIGSVSIGYQGYSGTQMVFREGTGIKTHHQIEKIPAKLSPEEDIF
jgi:uncharacterized membrane protein